MGCNSPPAYNDYGSSPHTDSCYNITQYADLGGLPPCPAAAPQGTFHINNACHSNTAFSDWPNWTNVYSNTCLSYDNWPNHSRTDCVWTRVDYGDTSDYACNGYYSRHGLDYHYGRQWPDTVYHAPNQQCYWHNYYDIGGGGTTTYTHQDGYSSSSHIHSTTQVAHSDSCGSTTTHSDAGWNNGTRDSCLFYANYYTPWNNYAHTSHVNFCNHADS